MSPLQGRCKRAKAAVAVDICAAQRLGSHVFTLAERGALTVMVKVGAATRLEMARQLPAPQADEGLEAPDIASRLAALVFDAVEILVLERVKDYLCDGQLLSEIGEVLWLGGSGGGGGAGHGGELLTVVG